ncbi:type III secretion system effector E3 ubiquitin ligase (YopM/NopM family) [Bradyrhizobium macuxiense]|uniref:Type III secretion system effector E3 ubiquitin ligase (YopM/NopM family) n=1 Tax=Bradyrhizobium macuxiense TaxID=1755647 RepID=A0A560LBN0_9BRAD|nr:NEL-type E3 ubiquitin ligase domain-containing protein [Bradyrhizobium macuxiense]TWB92986.1 type III secretion system effector E3 ubiquitin ligase (YopM/NopM family) [Bradyrhizobium macuxiense]
MTGARASFDASPASEPSLDEILDAWAGVDGQDEAENRQEAARRTRAWRAAGDADGPLNLSRLSLTALPTALPEELQDLNVGNNRLTSLPAALPDVLQRLRCNVNQIVGAPSCLPAPLRSLSANHNALSRLPDALPAGLRELDVRVNYLTSLPDTLPAQLSRLVVGNNRLTSLPAILPAAMRALYVHHNRLTDLPDTLPAGLVWLDASRNQLTNLPEPLPAGLQTLNVGRNQLTSLPDTLPLRTLHVSHNQLTSLPETLSAELQNLVVSNNQLTSLPEALPAGLRTLEAAHNRLTHLPETLPAGLELLDVRSNQLTSLPETLLTQLRPWCRVDLDGNPLPERVLTNLATAINAPGYVGPRVFFSIGGEAGPSQPPPLHAVVADWVGGEPEMMTAWQEFAEEAGAQEYALFLDRLRRTVNYGNAAFRQAVAEDLQQVATRPRLRELYFQQALGASASCEDRITLAWNHMQSARLSADVEDGAYDDRLDELLEQARVLFRLGVLDRIAREKVDSLRFVDEIEVYLAYQVKLRGRLELQLLAPDMRFFAVSYVTEDDLAAAETRVRHEEATQFDDYLATRWQPWETVLSRIEPEAHSAMQERLLRAMEEELPNRLQQRLIADGLTGDEAEIQLGALIREEIAREIKGALTRQVRRDRGL